MYKLINNLLYFKNNKKSLQLYILSTIEIEIFKLVYNKIGYLGYARTNKYIINKLYIFRILSKLYKFLRYYLYY